MNADRLSRRDRAALAVQRAIGRATAPLWLPATALLMRFGLGWRITGVAATRRAYRALCRAGEGPLLVCANHLTLVDSALVAWALGSPAWFLTHYRAFPWNVPERRNFAASAGTRVLTYLLKCLPVTRGGERGEVGRVLARLVHLLGRGEIVLIFPEGGRSRSGAVEVENAAYGVGRVIAALPGCRVLCVYLRGARQEGWSALPARGERFRVELECLHPTSELRGMRRAVDLAQQVVRALAALERRHFDGRQ